MKRLKVLNIVLVMMFVFIVPATLNGQSKRASQYKITYYGFGPVKVGMKVSAASKALGIPFTELEKGNDCHYANPKRLFKDVGFMVVNGRIARIDVDTRGYVTAAGAKIGDTEARIKSRYKGKVAVSPHKYTDGRYLTVQVNGGKFGIVFETDGKRVTHIRAGKSPEFGYIEGCS
ncbi:MAG: hypothetical protein M3367_00855 [Acidobacteriota bacterium]|nr:hypothetical protein [Acidobacteriota bacterium]